MPTHTITFTLPEEREEYETVLHATDFSLALDDFSNFLRQLWKRGFWDDGTELTEQEQDTIDKIKTKFVDILNDRDVSKYL